MATKKLTSEDLPRLMTRDEVAEKLGVSEKILHNWSSAGLGPPYIIINDHAMRFCHEDVLTWMHTQPHSGVA